LRDRPADPPPGYRPTGCHARPSGGVAAGETRPRHPGRRVEPANIVAKPVQPANRNRLSYYVYEQGVPWSSKYAPGNAPGPVPLHGWSSSVLVLTIAAKLLARRNKLGPA